MVNRQMYQYVPKTGRHVIFKGIVCKLSRCNLTKLEAIQARHPVGVGGRLLRHHRGFLVGFQVMHVCAGLVTGSASALTSYLTSGAPGKVVHVKNIFPYLNKD